MLVGNHVAVLCKAPLPLLFEISRVCPQWPGLVCMILLPSSWSVNPLSAAVLVGSVAVVPSQSIAPSLRFQVEELVHHLVSVQGMKSPVVLQPIPVAYTCT
jgi:hypothetical protein